MGLFFLGSAFFFDIQLKLRLVNYLLMAAGYFLPVFPCCPISKQRYAYNGSYGIFDQGQPVWHIVFIIGPVTEEV